MLYPVGAELWQRRIALDQVNLKKIQDAFGVDKSVESCKSEGKRNLKTTPEAFYKMHKD